MSGFLRGSSMSLKARAARHRLMSRCSIFCRRSMRTIIALRECEEKTLGLAMVLGADTGTKHLAPLTTAATTRCCSRSCSYVTPHSSRTFAHTRRTHTTHISAPCSPDLALRGIKCRERLSLDSFYAHRTYLTLSRRYYAVPCRPCCAV